MQLQIIFRWRLGITENSRHKHMIKVTRWYGFLNTRTSSHTVTCLPGSFISLAIRGPRQNQGMPRPVSRQGPGLAIIVIHFLHNSIRGLPQANTASLIRKVVCPRANYPGNPKVTFDISWDSRRHQISKRRHRRPFRKNKINIPTQPPLGNVFRPRLGIIQFNKLKLPTIHLLSRMVQDFRNRDPAATRRRTNRLIGQFLPRWKRRDVDRDR